MSADLAKLVSDIVAFRDERDWGQFHTFRNLMAAIGVEVAELQELALWKTDDEVSRALKDPAYRARVEEETADVLIYALLFADRAGFDAHAIIRRKLTINAAKYPVALSKGSAAKYTELNNTGS